MLSKDRNSAIELLRIVSMFFVVLLHFNWHGINPEILDCGGGLTIENAVGHIFESIAIVAVDVFVLISGFFGIRFKIKGVLKLFLVCLCWGMISYLLYCLLGHHAIGLPIFGRIMAFTHNKWWFIVGYLYLYFASPFLNKAIDHLDFKTFFFILLLYSFSTVYIGYCRDMGDNNIGMSFAQFVYLYLIGRFIGKSFDIHFFVRNRKRFFLAWFLFSGVTLALAIINQEWLKLRIPYLRPYPYNSPWILGASICLLCLALSYSFQNKSINRISGSVLPAYLLQDSSYFGYQWLYPFSFSFLAPFPLFLKYCLLLVGSVSFVVACIGMDLLLKRIVYAPILDYYDRIIYPKEVVVYSWISLFIDGLLTNYRKR